MTDQQLIAAAIACSGLTSTQFAERVLARDPRTVRRWRDGSSPIPPIARQWLLRYLHDNAPNQ